MIYALVPTDTTEDEVLLLRSPHTLARALISVAEDENTGLLDEQGNELSMDEPTVVNQLIQGNTVRVGSEDSNIFDRGQVLTLDDEYLNSAILLNVLHSCDAITLDDDFVRYFELTEEAEAVFRENRGPFHEACDTPNESQMDEIGLELTFFNGDGDEVRASFTIGALLCTHLEANNGTGTKFWSVKDAEGNQSFNITCHSVFTL